LHQFAEDNGFSLYEALVDHAEEMQLISKHLPAIGTLLQQGDELVRSNAGVYETMKFLLTKADFEDRVKILSKNEEDEQYLQVLYDKLLSFDNNFDDQDFVEPNHSLAYLQEEALGAEEDDEQLPNRVTLLTIHAAKGLENKVVFLTGVNKGVFPSKRSAFNQEQLEEERRALYVALTRAQKELYITYVNGE
jgi:DNA helicase-2/ATP-dependent DNA helicase PcrA